MLRRDSGQSVSFRDGFRSRDYFHMGRGLLPVLAVMLLAAPQLAMAQGGLAVTVDPRTLEVTEEGATGQYTVVLDVEPSDNVTITVVGAPVNGTAGADITVSTTSLTFMAPTKPGGDDGTWNTAQPVTVTANADADAVSETVTLTHTAVIGDDGDSIALSNSSVRVTANDNEMREVTVVQPTGTLNEAGSVTYTVVLTSEPTDTVTVDVGGISGELTVSPSRLFFTADNYSTPETVTVYAGEDLDADDDMATLTHTVRGGDYTGVSAAPVPVTVDDNDEHGVTVTPTALDVAVGARGTFTVVLNTRPAGSVRITVTEPTPGVDDFRVSPSSVSFSSSNWNRPQTVTVLVDSDFDNSATPSVALANAIDTSSSSSDAGYDGETVDPVTVTVSDSMPGVRLSRTSMTINEGGTATYTVRLASAPTADTTVGVSVPTGLGFSADPTSLDFTAPNGGTSNWNTAQTVTVSAADDENAVQETVTITHTIGTAIVANGILRATVRESHTRGVTINPTSLEVTEGGSGSYSVVLDSEPVDDHNSDTAANSVTVTIAGVSGDVTVLPSQLVFTGGTGGTWSTAQEVQVSAENDDDGETDAPVTLSHTVRGSDYEGTRAGSVRVTIKEIHSRGLIVDTMPADEAVTSSLTVAEGATGMYSVMLESQPTGTVTVTVRGASGDVSVSPSSLTFTTSNWDDAQMVEVKAGQDADAEPDPVVTLTHAASGGGYSGVTGGMVTVTITEDDTHKKGVIVTPTALTVTEGGAAERYTLVLGTEPTGNVTITLGRTDTSTESLVATPTTLTFTRGNWNIPQPVTVRAPEDNNATGGTVTLTHEVNGGGYDLEMPSNVVVQVSDNDSAAIILSTMTLEMGQGMRRTYTVALGSEPADNETVNITGAPSGVSVGPAALVFTPANWSTPRTVTVHALATADTGAASLLHAADNFENQTLTLDVKDSDTPGVAINPTSLNITEGGSDSYTVVLTSEPTATVHVNVEVTGASDDVRLNRTRLSFSTGNWDREQTVTVTLAEDDDAVADGQVTLTHTSSGADEYEDTDATTDGVQAVDISPVTVTLAENDMTGVTANPTALTVAAGSSGTYRVHLMSEPLDAVTVTVNSPSEDITVAGSPLVFNPDDWNQGKTVTVSVAADAGTEEEQSFMLTHDVTGSSDYAGLEGPTVALTIPVQGAPSTPRGLTAEAGDQSVRLTWRAPANNGGSAIVRYEVRHQEVGGSYGAWSTVPGGATATSTTVGNLENGKDYEFQVRAANAVAAGQPATASATLAESAPGAPASFTATAGDEQVALSWGAASGSGSDILRYEYRYAAAGRAYDDAWTTVSGAGNARSVTVSNLTNGTEYRFQVRAVNSIGDGTAAEARATPGRAPTAPTGVTARVESETITVKWGMPADTGGSDITGYQVRYRMNGSGWSSWRTVAGGGSATSYTMTGLTNGIGHEIQVAAVNAIGRGAVASVEATPMEGLNFAHFANGTAGEVTITSDIVLVNVETSAVTPAIYFYNQMGDMIDADSVVDVTGDLMVNGDGALTVPMGIPSRGEMTISTNGEGALVVGSARVFGTGRLGGVLRFDIPAVGVAGVGASEPVSDAIFPARRMIGGVRTGAAIRNLSADDMTVTCMLMQGGEVMDTAPIMLDGDGHHSAFIDEMFPGADTVDFVGSVRCTAPDDGMFVGVALEMDAANGIFTTLPMVPLGSGAGSCNSTLNFAHFANGDFGGTATSSDLVFVNVATSAVAPAIHFFDQMGNMIDAAMVVDATMDGVEVADGVLMVTDEIPVMGEMTVTTSGMGEGMVGSVRVVSDGPIGGVLRFNIPSIGVAGVGASDAVNAAIFPARRMAAGINTGAAIRNLMADMTSVTCRLMMGGQRLGEKVINLPGNGQNSEFINEMFANANTDDFTGSVHCTAPSGSMFTGVALEMDFNNGIFTTLPVVPVR
ncbi:MAG: fibronectin type III domain-containing protein [Acidobacteriota bacterium]|nr:fibronectin type III domain-containing protein [Acidobacteriota bacterium]